MALYEFQPQKISQSRYICIPSYETIDNITKYSILITIGKYYWNVTHRYSDFYDLNEKLANDRIIDRSVLPPKKIFGNQSDTFIQRRKNDLEQYLKALFTLDPLPHHLILFLEFEKYEIHSITESLAESLWENGDRLLQINDIFHMAPLQCHALTEKLKLPKTTTSGSKDAKKDVGHILDFLSKINMLLICGSFKEIGSSNIVPNQLEFSLMSFKALQSLKLVGCNPDMIKGLTSARKTVIRLQIQDTLKNLKDFFLSEIVHWDCGNIPDEFKWNLVLNADFSYNQLDSIDDSIYLLPWVETLDLSHNRISSVTYLDKLSHLSHLDLSYNSFTEISDLHTKLGKIVSVKFIGNNIDSLKGFSKLYSLVDLDIQNNQITHMTDINYLVNLPCLDKLNLIGNPLVNSVDYRTRVLEQFNARASEICLDSQRPTQKELDTVAILQAIRAAKEGAAQKSRVNTVRGKKNANDEQVDVIHLRGSHVSSSTCEDSSNKLNAQGSRDIDEFRRQVASTRAQGGTGWLRLWNQRQTQLHQWRPQLPPIPQSNYNIPQFKTPKCPTNLALDSPRDLVLPDWLPGPTDAEFLSVLDTHVASVLTKNPTQSGRIIAFYWIIIIWSPSRIRCCYFPALLVILPSCIIVFLLSDFDENRRPSLLPFRCISGKTLISLTIGHQLHFIKFEEKSCDDLSEYVLLLSSREICSSCAKDLQKLIEPGVKLQEISSPTAQSQCFSWVALDTDGKHSLEGSITCLSINNSEIMLSREIVCSLVMAKENGGDCIIASWNAKEEIVNLEIHSNMEKPRNLMKNISVTSPVFSISNRVKQVLGEAGFGITIWFNRKDLLSVRFPSRKNRDEFLDVLTQSRI